MTFRGWRELADAPYRFAESWLTLTGPTSRYVNVPSVAALNPASAFTLEGWVNVTDLGACSNIVGKNYQQAWWVDPRDGIDEYVEPAELGGDAMYQTCDGGFVAHVAYGCKCASARFLQQALLRA